MPHRNAWKNSGKASSQNVSQPPKIDIGSVKVTELPSYVQAIAKSNYSMTIPQEYIFTFSKGSTALFQETKKLSSLISSQMITFRESSLAKLYKQIDDQCKVIYAIMENFVKTYEKMHSAYIGSEMVITNFKEVNDSFALICTRYNDFLKLVEKIKNKYIRETWKSKLKSFGMGKAVKDGSKSKEILDILTKRIVDPTINCAKLIAAHEKKLKEHTRISQYSLGEEVEHLKLLKSKTQKELPKVLDLCKSGVEKTLEQIKVEKSEAEKKKNNRQLSKILELHGNVMEIESHVQMVEAKLRGALNEAEQVLKISKYSTGDHVEVLITLKSILKEMANFANEVFAVIVNSKTTEKQRMDKINAAVKGIEQRKKDIESTVTRITWNKSDNEVGQHTTEMRKSINEVSQKFAELNSSTDVRDLYKILVEWNKVKPSAFIAFIQKHGKFILIALGFLSRIL